MNKKIISFIILAGLFGMASLANAQIDNPIPYNSFCWLITKGIIPAVAMVVGALGVIMMIICGILFVTSAGSPEKVSKARAALTYAIGGIVIALAAEAIVGTIKYIVGASASCS